MSLTLYASSAPIFARHITALGACLDKAEAFAAEKKFDPNVLCITRFAPDMLSLTGQIHLATAFAKNAVCRLAAQTPPDYAPLEDSFAAYRARIEQTLEIIAGIKAEAFEGGEERLVTVSAGPDKTMEMNGADYLLNMALPNFYFHCTAAYSLLRHNGVQLGKMDFMGAWK